MTIRINIHKLLALLLMAVGLAACINDPLTDPTAQPGRSTMVKLEVRVQANDAPSTRALQQAQEDEVGQLTVFAFDKGTPANRDTQLRHIGRSVGPPQGEGTTKQFTVELYSGEWDIWVLANAGDFADELTGQALTKSDLQALIVHTQQGKWNVDPTDPNGAYRIPLWGMLDAVPIETSTTAISAAVNLYRMLAKIDVEVQRDPDAIDPATYPGITNEQFELTYVSLHNYNTTGRVVPGITAADGDWINPAGGAALRTSLPANPGTMNGWQPENRLEWSDPADFTTPGTALRGTIYTFEANAGTTAANRPCIIIGGRYNQSNEVTYYRADFATAADNYLSLLRNHRYTFIIRKIAGKGLSTVQEAYEAGPTNLEAEVIRWGDGGLLEGVWNGNYEIRFSTRNIHFDQFGDPDPQIINLRTNVPNITLDEFANITAGSGDNVWNNVGDGVWSNDHFVVYFEQTETEGAYTHYTITIQASITHSDDPARTATFKLKGYMLEVPITITQEHHLEYRLITTPDPTQSIFIDGAPQRIHIGVHSTSQYQVDFTQGDIFTGVYSSATDPTPVDPPVFDATQEDIYIGVHGLSGGNSVMGEFCISHTSTESNAPTKFYNVMQTSGIIVAELLEGGFSGFISRYGGQGQIKVESNLAGWHPTLRINNAPCPQALLPNFFDIVDGVKNQTVTFTAPDMTSIGVSNVVYEIKFVDANSTIETENTITFTQRMINANPPTGGTPAVAELLAVDANGVLNLEGNGYLVFFKWGSTVAIAGSASSFSPAQIAWMPEEYDAGHISHWDDIPYAKFETYGTAMPPNLPTQGLGDPCRLAVKNGVTGQWKMAPQETFVDVKRWNDERINGIRVYGREVNGIFMPAAGEFSGSGFFESAGSVASYWTTDATTTGAIRYFTFDKNNSSGTATYRGRTVGHTIRCVPAN